MDVIIVKDEGIVGVYNKFQRLEKLIYVMADEPYEPIHHRILREMWDAIKAHATGKGGRA